MATNKAVHSAGSALPVTKSNSTVFQRPTRGLYVGTSGDVTVRMAVDQRTITFANVQDGSILDIQVDQVRSTGTDASNIVALF